ncbi:MAG TPA: hypothetical protein ENI15_05760 [Spirochaetes bacterium]|nr:hypothetical protein [Spirochaetota bacterium]
MEILINDEKIDFELEEEENLLEIMNSLEEWILKTGNVIESISVDDRVIPIDFSSNEYRNKISLIKELKITVSNHMELALSTFVTVGEYINKMLGDYTGPDNIKHYDSLLEGLNLVYTGIIDSLRVLKIRPMTVVKDNDYILDETLSEMNDFIRVYEKKYPDADGIKKLKALLNKVLNFIPEVYKWAVIKNYPVIQGPGKERAGVYLHEIFNDLQSICLASIDKYEDIGKNLQIGEDRKALNDLFYLMELMDEVISVLKITGEIYDIGPKTQNGSGKFKFIDDLFCKMSGCLKEFESAFENGDMITVGDILEYEIKPLVDQFPDLFKKINDFIA